MKEQQLNKDYIKWQLQEASEQISNLIEEMGKDSDWGIGDYAVDMRHLYHHVNSAWNARYASEQEAADCTATEFERWRQYPNDLEIF